MANIFITGITGFLGSNLARILLEENHVITASYRPGSSRQSCSKIIDHVSWIQIRNGWEKEVAALDPDVIIHCAWIGVKHTDRNNWDTQFQNVEYLYQLLSITINRPNIKFIGLGSQSEYGILNKIASEEDPLCPVEAYGSVKIICSEVLKRYCSSQNVDWYWLRLFSLFGPGESENWLIPLLVKTILTGDEIDLTLCDQKYAYLYVDDFANAICKIINSERRTGIYNISGGNVLPLRDIIEYIRNDINPDFRLNFGTLPYRESQSMHIQGDTEKFRNNFGEFEFSNLNAMLTLTINDLRKNLPKQ